MERYFKIKSEQGNIYNAIVLENDHEYRIKFGGTRDLSQALIHPSTALILS
jgi:hypothetical protein